MVPLNKVAPCSYLMFLELYFSKILCRLSTYYLLVIFRQQAIDLHFDAKQM